MPKCVYIYIYIPAPSRICVNCMLNVNISWNHGSRQPPFSELGCSFEFSASHLQFLEPKQRLRIPCAPLTLSRERRQTALGSHRARASLLCTKAALGTLPWRGGCRPDLSYCSQRPTVPYCSQHFTLLSPLNNVSHKVCMCVCMCIKMHPLPFPKVLSAMSATKCVCV